MPDESAAGPAPRLAPHAEAHVGPYVEAHGKAPAAPSRSAPAETSRAGLSPDFHPNGPAIAAFLSAALAMLTLSVVQVASHVSKGFQEAVFALGKAWIPGAEGIGPYSGKETIMLVAWLVFWVGTGSILRKQQLDTRRWFGAALAIVLVAAILVWPPVWHLFA